MATMNELSPSFQFQKMSYINVLKLMKFGEDRLNRFRDMKQKPSGGGEHFAPLAKFL